MITKDTTLCISIAERPGNFGTRFFNQAFEALQMDFIYKAMKLEGDGDLEGVVRGIRALGIRGCGVSMPFKERVIEFLDALEETAKKTGAVNTIVNNSGNLTGYNTDYKGVCKVLRHECDVKGQDVFVCGLGGVAKAIVTALKDLGANVLVAGRDEMKRREFSKNLSVETVPWQEILNAKGYLFVNATPIGMSPHETSTVAPLQVLQKFEIILDVVLQPVETKIIQTAKEAGLKVIPGNFLAFEQAMEQFELYTKKKAPREWLWDTFVQKEEV